jgi:hypothetical protein
MHHSPLLAIAASVDPDTMYLHQALKEPDKAQWLKAMEEEVNAHISNGNWEMVPRRSVPVGVPVLPAVWAMRCKRRIATREVYKWKARLNLDGSKQVKGVNYQETYAPVAGWSTIRIVLMTAILKNWPTKQIDYVMAYSQADVENDKMFMQIPKGFELDSAQAEQWVLKLKKNLYGQKQAGRVWNKHLVTRLKQIGFKQSLVDECLFFKDKIIYVLYTDDSILTGPNEKDLDKVIEEINRAGLDITVEGDVSDFLGVKIERMANGNVNLTQPHLIDQILSDLRLIGNDKNQPTTKKTPMACSHILHKHPNSESFDGHFDYRSVIGKMLYLENSTRPDIAYSVNQ